MDMDVPAFEIPEPEPLAPERRTTAALLRELEAVKLAKVEAAEGAARAAQRALDEGWQRLRDSYIDAEVATKEARLELDAVRDAIARLTAPPPTLPPKAPPVPATAPVPPTPLKLGRNVVKLVNHLRARPKESFRPRQLEGPLKAGNRSVRRWLAMGLDAGVVKRERRGRAVWYSAAKSVER